MHNPCFSLLVLDICIQAVFLSSMLSHLAEKRIYNIPTGSWGGRMGVMMQQDLLSIYDSLVPRYQQVLGISIGSTETIRQSMIQEWNDLHTLWSTFVVYGQK